MSVCYIKSFTFISFSLGLAAEWKKKNCPGAQALGSESESGTEVHLFVERVGLEQSRGPGSMQG